jgi:Family of unknown function (DUF5829)
MLAPLPTVGLNHFYVAIEAPTYAAIRANEFLWQQFAPGEERATRANQGQGWTGQYFYGQHTYFEFLQAEAMPGISPGQCGLALGTDQAGLTTQVLARFAASGHPMSSGLRVRAYAGAEVPWFHCTPMQIFSPDLPLAVWLMEYAPTFLAQWNPQATAPPSPGDIRRAAILARYRAVLPGPVPAQPLLQDVTALDWEFTQPQAQWLAGYLANFDLAVAASQNGYTIEGQAIIFRIVVGAETKTPCLRRVHFSLSRPYNHTEKLPNSELRLSGQQAVWTFSNE